MFLTLTARSSSLSSLSSQGGILGVVAATRNRVDSLEAILKLRDEGAKATSAGFAMLMWLRMDMEGGVASREDVDLFEKVLKKTKEVRSSEELNDKERSDKELSAQCFFASLSAACFVIYPYAALVARSSKTDKARIARLGPNHAAIIASGAEGSKRRSGADACTGSPWWYAYQAITERRRVDENLRHAILARAHLP